MLNDKAYRAIQRELLVRHFDANETLFLERELTQLRAKLFEVMFPELIARTLAPKATDIAASAETYSFKVYKPVGEAKMVAYKGGDIPRVDVVADEVLGKVRPIGFAYGWDLNELRESARLGLQLSEVKARTARDACERAIDEVLAFGSLKGEDGLRANLGLNGITNNALVAAPMSGQWWLNPTPLAAALVLKDLSDLVISVSNRTLDVFKTNSVLLPLKHYNYIKEAIFSTLTGETILQVFQKNHPNVTISPWYRLDTAGAGGLARAIAYQKDPMILEAVIPQEFEQLPPEMKGFEFIINCHARSGGVKLYQPTAMTYMDFAAS